MIAAEARPRSRVGGLQGGRGRRRRRLGGLGVGDDGAVAVGVVGRVSHGLHAAVGQEHAVATGRHCRGGGGAAAVVMEMAALLPVAVVIAAGQVTHRVAVRVGRALKQVPINTCIKVYQYVYNLHT